MKVSFDFDGTLTLRAVQSFCAELINKGHEVWICTMRDSDEMLAQRERKGGYSSYDNVDLYEVCWALNIPLERIIFCNETSKSPFLEQHDFVFHLDDDPYVLHEISLALPYLPINVLKPNWRTRCLQAIEDAA